MGGQARVAFAFHFYNNIKEPGAALTRSSVLSPWSFLSPQILTIKVVLSKQPNYIKIF